MRALDASDPTRPTITTCLPTSAAGSPTARAAAAFGASPSAFDDASVRSGSTRAGSHAPRPVGGFGGGRRRRGLKELKRNIKALKEQQAAKAAVVAAAEEAGEANPFDAPPALTRQGSLARQFSSLSEADANDLDAIAIAAAQRAVDKTRREEAAAERIAAEERERELAERAAREPPALLSQTGRQARVPAGLSTPSHDTAARAMARKASGAAMADSSLPLAP